MSSSNLGVPVRVQAASITRITGMNKTEYLYSLELSRRKALGEIIWWAYEPMKLRLARGAYYTPDFAVLRSIEDGQGHDANVKYHAWLEFHEVKGFFREAARVRIKVAADLFPFRFIVVRRGKGGGWEVEEV